jgi:hypothetical protein
LVELVGRVALVDRAALVRGAVLVRLVAGRAALPSGSVARPVTSARNPGLDAPGDPLGAVELICAGRLVRDYDISDLDLAVAPAWARAALKADLAECATPCQTSERYSRWVS